MLIIRDIAALMSLSSFFIAATHGADLVARFLQ